MNNNFLNSHALPYCPGCGHHLIAKNTEKALEKLGIDVLDTILVTDIGCHGIIDRFANSHTVHGLHGRSAALGTGVSLGLADKSKKVIVFAGDGGVTIGMQHILEAARQNIDMTVIIHNNMLYGMTGGQASGFTPSCFKTTTTPQTSGVRNYDICAFAGISKASYVRRIIARGDFADELAEAISTEGFSLVEVLEVCPSYGLKLNKGVKMDSLLEDSGQEEGVWKHDNKGFSSIEKKGVTDNLFSNIEEIETAFKSDIDKPMSIIISGSAGEAVQTAASFYAQASMASGLSVNLRGSYPVTVGVGFSTAEIIVSPQKDCNYTVSSNDVVIITSQDGLNNNMKRINDMKSGTLIIDKSLECPETGADVITEDFRKMGKKTAALFAVFYAVKTLKLFPIDALKTVIAKHRMADKLPIDKIENELNILNK